MPGAEGGTIMGSTTTTVAGVRFPTGWRAWSSVLASSWREVMNDNIFLAAGGVSYAMLLALFPGLTALVSLYGLMLDPITIEHQVNALAAVLPLETRKMLAEELHQLASTPQGALGFGAVFGLLFAVWTASRGISGMMNALNIAYEARDERSFLRFNGVALALTGLAVLGAIVALVLLAGVPAVASEIGLGRSADLPLGIVQWLMMLALMLVALAVLYRYGPAREAAQWEWLSPGSLAATLLWLLATGGFTLYVSHFPSYDKTYGSLGGAAVLLTWLYISAFVVLIGGVINAQVERVLARQAADAGA